MPSEIEFELANQYGNQSLVMKLDGQRLMLDVVELDRLIEALGDIRAELSPAPAEDVYRGERYPVETQPDWFLHYHPMFDGLLCFLRHTGFGWVGFGLSNESVAALTRNMVAPSARETASLARN